MLRNSALGSFAFSLLILLTVSGCKSRQTSSLFDGKSLAGWEVYLRAASDTTPPPGLNNDPDHVFSVAAVDGSPCIRVSGETFGGLSTVEEFSNYHLRLQFKWGEAKTTAFRDRKRDSGLLYHAVGPHGVDAGSWMRSQEFQIQETDCGDYWGVAGGSFDIPSVQNDKGEWVYSPSGALLTFNETSPQGRRCIKSRDMEKPHGEWNQLDLYCYGDSSVHVLNGEVVMRLYHSAQVDSRGKRPLTKGKFQIQSEGCEIFFRGIEWEPIDGIPSNLTERQ